VRPRVTSRMLAWEKNLPLVVPPHYHQLIFYDDGLIDQMLKFFIVGVEQLKLFVVIESIEKHLLSLLIHV
jgi:hypothetical protein